MIDLLAIGRANLDLYSQDIGAAFEDVTGFDAMVGGSPTNIAIGVSRLGMASAVLTAVGTDRTGDFVLRYLRDEGVGTSFVPRIDGKLTSLALLGVQPPDAFPLSFYREDPADIYLAPSDVDAVDLSTVRAIEVSGNALARGSCVDAVHQLLRAAADHNIAVYMDVDLRPSEWARPSDYGAAIRSVLDQIDVLIGTEEEFFAAFMEHPEAVMSGDRFPPSSASALAATVSSLLDDRPGVIVTKRGPNGATVESVGRSIDVAGFPVDVVNTVGAGDSFAAGLISSRLNGLDWEESTRFANACGAITVTRHGCASALPTLAEVDAFLAERTVAER
ncbi:MAG: 5-dehydro-2-deoxygluconokinase [Acidimicrobiia bacterium]